MTAPSGDAPPDRRDTGRLTTHVLATAHGCSAAGMRWR